MLAGSFSLHAQIINFTGTDSSDYSDPGNWSGDAVPDLTSGATAVIGSPYNVTYQPGPDLVIDNNSILQINSGGSWTQIAGGSNAGAYIQLQGNGGIVVNGGTFNQGTSSSNPFNITGTGNYFTINSGAANFNTSVVVNPGFTYTQNGGIVTVSTAGEFDFNGGTTIINGGILNTRLITGVNAGAGNPTVLTFSGGTINLSGNNTDFNGFFPGNPATVQYVNFTLNSTGVLNFAPGVAETDVQGFINDGNIKYNGAIDMTDLVVTNEGAFYSISVEGATVPEPSTWAMLAAGLLFLLVRMTARRRQVVLAAVRR